MSSAPKIDLNNPLTQEDLYVLNRSVVWVTSNYFNVPDIDEYGVVDVANRQVNGANWSMSFSDYGLWLAYKVIEVKDEE